MSFLDALLHFALVQISQVVALLIFVNYVALRTPTPMRLQLIMLVIIDLNRRSRTLIKEIADHAFSDNHPSQTELVFL
jgi:hypothetical protein